METIKVTSNQAEPKKSPAIFMSICSRPPYRLQTIRAGSILFSVNKFLPSVSKECNSDFAPFKLTGLGTEKLPFTHKNLYCLRGIHFSGGQISYLASKEGYEAKMSDVRFKDDLPKTLDRSTRMQVLRPHLASDDLRINTAFIDFVKQAFCTRTHTKNGYLYATHTRKVILYILIGSANTAKNAVLTPLNFDSSHLNPYSHTHTSSQFGDHQNA